MRLKTIEQLILLGSSDKMFTDKPIQFKILFANFSSTNANSKTTSLTLNNIFNNLNIESEL